MAFPENTVNDTGIKHIWDKVTAALSGKVDKVSGKGLSTNDYTTAEKEKLSGIEAGAQVNAVTSVAGKTGAVTLDKADVGLGNVDNTSDASKPISTATQNALDTKADTSEVAGTQTATGNPITLTDASETYAQGLTVELEPKQDLHGYDFPWVGGAGKNKLPLTVEGIKSANTGGSWSGNVYTDNGVTFTIQTDSNDNVTGITINRTGTSTISANFVLAIGFSIPDGTYTLSGLPTNIPAGYGQIQAFVTNNGQDITWADRGSDTSISTKTATNYTDLRLMLMVYTDYSASNIDYKPMIESGTQATPFAPWENICPISGYEGVEVDDVGKNIFDISNANWKNNYFINSSGAEQSNNAYRYTQNLIPVKPSTTYTIQAYYNTTVELAITVPLYDKDGNFISRAYVVSTTGKGLFSGQFTTTQDCVYVRMSVAIDSSNIQVEEGSQPTTYEPYTTRTASVTFGQTVYGGRSYFTEGGTDDTYENVDLGDLSWTYSQYERFEAQVSNVNKTMYTTDDMLCSCFKPDYSPISASGVDGTIAIYSDGSLLIICKEYTDASTFKTAMTGQTVCYKKATASSIATPKTDLKLLQDTNNLTTNGTTITIDYIPNNSIGDAVKASEEYTDRAVGRAAPKATLIDTWMISEESDTISVDLTAYDCNFFLLEYLFQSKRGTTLIPRPQGGTFSASVVTYNNGTALYIELDYNPTTKELAYTSNVTSQFGILAIYTI